MSKRVFITGISGFLASHIALQLLNSGAEVKGSVRSLAKADHTRKVLQTHGADTSRLSFVELDLLSDKGWDEEIAGCDYLIHTASPFVTTMPKDPQSILKPAIEGTVRAINAGLAANVKHIVLTSSMVAVAHGHGKNHTAKMTEKDWTDIKGGDVNTYYQSKTLAEKKAWEVVEAAGRRDILTVINPGLIFGPVLEKDIGTSGALIRKMLTGGFPGSPNIGFACVDVRDVAALHIKAMDSKEFYGRRVLAMRENIQLVDLAKELAKAFPAYAKKLPTRQLPDFMVKLVALFDGDAKTASRSLGYKYNVDFRPAEKLLGRNLISNEKAVRAMAGSIIDLGLA